MTVCAKRTDRQPQMTVRKQDDGPCEMYGPSTVGPGAIMRCTLCIRTVSKNDGLCETYGPSTANNGP